MNGVFPFNVICRFMGHRWAEFFDYANTQNELVDRCERCGKIKYRPWSGGGTC